MKHRFPFPLSLLLSLGIVLGACSALPKAHDSAMQMDGESADIPMNICENNEEHGVHGTGKLFVRYDKEGKVERWECIFTAHHICYAPADGKWNECTFPPDVMTWPTPVRAELIANPALLINEFDEMNAARAASSLSPPSF